MRHHNTGRIVLRAIEVIFSLIIIGVYFGTNTFFSFYSPEANNFGSFVLFGGLVSAVVMLGVGILMELEKDRYVVIVYNAVWVIFYLAAAFVTFFNWTNPPAFFITSDQMRNGALTVGSFCLFQVVILLINSFLYVF